MLATIFFFESVMIFPRLAYIILHCGEISNHYVQYFSLHELNLVLTFYLVTYRQTQSEAYEPTVDKHRWAQKCNLTLAESPPLDLHK